MLAALSETQLAKQLTVCFLPGGYVSLPSGCRLLVRLGVISIAARTVACFSANPWAVSCSVSCSYRDLLLMHVI